MALRELIHSREVHANIPRKKNTKTSSGHMDWLIYQVRHVVENTFASLKYQQALSRVSLYAILCKLSLYIC